FDVRDDSAAPQVIVINETLARTIFSGRRAVGERVRFYAWADQPWTVVGVVADVKTAQLDQPAPPTIYYPDQQGSSDRMSFVVRSTIAPAILAPIVRRAVHDIDPLLPVYAVRTMIDEINDSPAVYARRYPLVLLGVFAVAALVLAIVGIAGVVSYSVSQRMR